MTKKPRVSSASSFGWSFMIQGGTQAINFIVTILLARLLLPEEFGLIGMIAIFIAIARALVDGGFVSSLIRTKEVDNIDYSTVFFTNMVSAIILYGVLFFTAPYIANFYNQEILISILRILGLILIINAFSLVQSTKLNKALLFKTQFKLQLPSLIISAVISIWMAYNNYGVWSLVAKDLIYALLTTLQLWLYSKWTPSMVFDKEKFKYHFNFGYKLSLTQIVNTTFDNLYKVVIGKFFSAAQLGYYTRARSLEQLPSSFFYNAFNRVAYPLLAKIENEKQLKETYAKLMRLVVFLVTPILVYLGVVAEPFFRWLLTEKWLPAVPYFQILILSGVFYPIYKYNLNICQLKGRSDLVLKLSIFQNGLLVIGALSAIWFGIYGLLYSLLVINIIVTGTNASISGNLINYGIGQQVKDLIPIFAVNIIVAFFTFIFYKNVLYDMSDMLILLIIGASAFILYGAISYVAKLRTLSDMIELIKQRG
ncbi:lipopolysaccharide biosynthesis protein [Mesonia ostreae]|uniref:Lipopolysaccharide biosynthesis protein n=1 Tax=Mesonia ostreae TaxID=861110 RepID=A0ABU2KHD0_9FLAO|nr:lipopolysaccharide biosynthesis protein [Mesonia ostreae]MDT0294068.1 lipopolysaccharide biosynthesis protein [Mesonia ostreae]